jgi:hypothetical protein
MSIINVLHQEDEERLDRRGRELHISRHFRKTNYQTHKHRRVETSSEGMFVMYVGLGREDVLVS